MFFNLSFRSSHLTIFSLLLILLTLSTGTHSQVPVRSSRSSDYLVVGQNSLQRIHYSSSSSFSSVHQADKALDDNHDTSWISAKGNDPHWVEVDFGIKRLMSHIVIKPGRKDRSRVLKTFTLQFLHENKWFDHSTIDLTSREYRRDDTVKIDLGGIDASTFRIYIPENGTMNGYAAISAIEIYLGSSKIELFDSRLKNLILPIRSGVLPDNPSFYPNAPRGYRGGRHVGLDIYHYFDDTTYERRPVTKQTDILASGAGTVIRADRNYVSMTPEEWQQKSAYYQNNPRTYVKKSFGGIQVWIDHGNGIVTTYNHLSSIDSRIQVGSTVTQGQVIGKVGNTGLYGDAIGSDYGVHLHFEIWVDGNYLGYGMEFPEIQRYLRWMFFQLQ